MHDFWNRLMGGGNIFETPADGGSGGDAGADPAADAPAPSAEPAAPSTAPPPAAAEPAAAPWAESLSTRFTDETQRQAVDAYLREEIQPYITRREQELGGYNELISSLQDEDQSISTYLAMTEQLYGEEAAQSVAQAMGLFGDEPEGGESAEGELAGDDLETWLAQQPEPIQEMVLERIANQEDSAYESALTDAAQVEASIAQNETAQALFDKYVVAVEGDVEAALELWQQDQMPRFVSQFDGQPAPEGEPPAPAAPTTLGQQSAAPGAQPGATVPDYGGDLDAALDDFMGDIRAAAVGSAGPS